MTGSAWPAGDGEMARRIREHDWAATPLGPTAGWSQSLKVATRLLLTSRHPMFIWWRPELIQLYNDAYRETMGPEKHPSALGNAGQETWAEIWDTIGPQIERILAGGAATWHEDQLVPVTRHGGRQDVWWTYSFSPIDEEGAPNGIGGVLVICRDVTENHLAREAALKNEARQAFLLRLSDALRPLSDPEQIKQAAAHLLGEQLGVDRAAYAELLPDGEHMVTADAYVRHDVSSIAGVYHAAEFGKFFKAQQSGSIAVIEDAKADTSIASFGDTWGLLGIRAAIAYPVVKQGRLVAAFYIHSIEPRRWLEAEISLVAEVGERTWDAVERTRTEVALRESEERYRSLFGSMEEACAVVEVVRDEAGRWSDFLFLEVNPAFTAHTGVPDPVGRTATQILGTPNPHWAELCGRVAETGESARTEVSEATLGRIFDLNVFRLDGPGSRRVAVLFTDVTARRRSEQALRDSEARFRALATAGSYSIYRMSTDWAQLYQLDGRNFLADTGEPITGWAEQYIPPDDLPRVSAAIAAAIRDTALFELEHRVWRANGGVGWVLSRAVPILDEDGGIVEWFGAGSDITPRKNAEEKARQSEELRRIALDGGGMGAWRWDLRERLIWGDARFLALWSHPPSDAPHPLALFTRRMSPESAAEMEAIVTRVIEGGEEFDGQLEIASGPTAGRWVRWRGRASGQEPWLLHGVSFDVTDQRRAATALRESEVRQAFLLKLSDALRPLADALEIQRTAMDHVAEHFSVDMAAYIEFGPDGDRGAIREGHRSTRIPFPPEVRLSDFGPVVVDELLAGRTFPYEDAETDPRLRSHRDAYRALNIRSGVGIPLIKAGRLASAVAVNHTEPRRWTGAELRLLEDVAERTWDAVERARAEAALRESEERLRQFGEASLDILWIRDADTLQWTYLTPAFEAIYGLSREEALTGDNYRNWQDLIVPEDRDHAVTSISRVGAGERVTFEYRIRRPADGQVRWLRDTDFPMCDEAGRVVRIGGVGHDVTALKAIQAAMAESETRLRTLMEGIPQLVWRSCDKGLWTWSSPQWMSFTGQAQEESHGFGWLVTVHPDDHAAAMQAWDEARPHGRLDVEYRVRRASDGAWLWHRTLSVPVRDAPGPDGVEGRILEWLGTTTDIDDLKSLQGQQQVLVAELQHRTRNLLAVVRNVARRSIGSSPGRDEYDARLAALGRVQGFLSRSPGYSVPLGDVVEAELHAAGDGASDKVGIAGPVVDLPGESVQAVALALHELATNAVKYGAIAQPSAQLSVTWRIETGDDGTQRLVIDWRESGVTMQAGPPARRGYGTELITRALPYQLRAETALEFTPDGVRCRIILPASAFTSRTEKEFA